jgi:hypothetical protein
MSKLLAVEGMTLTIDPPTVLGTITITGLPMNKAKQDGSKVYLDGLSVSISGVTNPSAGATIPDPVPAVGNINSSAIKTKQDGTLVLFVGDETSTITSNPLIPGLPPTPSPVNYKVKISVAGQLKAKSV